MKIIILDTETTGTLEEDRIIQLSYLVVNENAEILEVHDDLCSVSLDIKYDAMAIHHIVPEALMNKPICKETKAFKRLLELNTPDNLMVIQNAKFDLDMLSKEDFTCKMKLVDTFRILRANYPLDTPHGLQHKRYQWGLYKFEQDIIDKLGVEIKAHDALGDVIVLKNLFDRLANEQNVDSMIELCAKPILLKTLTFGKHKGKDFNFLAINERSSLQYMLDKFDLDDDMLYTIKYHMEQSKDDVILTLGFGKYKGQTPEDVITHDRGYLEWIRDKAENITSELKDEIIRVLQ
jgi:exodeoxyribonuclease X